MIQKSVISDLLPLPNEDPMKPLKAASKASGAPKKSSKKQRYTKSTVTLDDMVYEDIDSDQEHTASKTQLRLANEIDIFVYIFY